MCNGESLLMTVGGVEYKLTKTRRLWARGSYYVGHDLTHDVFLSSFDSVSSFRKAARSGYFFERDGFK